MTDQTPTHSELSNLLTHLSGDDALAVLRLLAEDETLAAQIEQVAMAYLEDSSPGKEEDIEAITGEVYWALEQLEVEEVWDRAGPKRDGYVDPAEAADQMIDEILEPYRVDITHYQELGLGMQAMRLCLGVVAGLYRFDQESEAEFKNWAVDSFSYHAEDILTHWRQNRPSRELIQAAETFIQENLSHWRLSWR